MQMTCVLRHPPLTPTSPCFPSWVAEEGDFTTAYSYYYEAYEQYAALSSPRALPLLKLMLLAKVPWGPWPCARVCRA